MNQNFCVCAQNGTCAAANQYEKKKRRKGLRIVGVLLIVCLLFSAFSMLGQDTAPNSDYIAVLNIEGTISENDGYTYDQQYLLQSVDDIMNDKYNKGLLLRIDSPGGAVYQIDELYLKLMDYKKTTGRPVYAAVESYAASGGYYEACAADQIYANRNSITGSIGVIMGEFLDLSELLDNLGVDVSYITSGANKAMGNSYEPLTEEQKAIYQSICDESYEQFVGIVAQSRDLDEKTVRTLADGRVYTASQALEHGLIDGIEPYADTLERMKADLGYEDIDVWTYSYQAPATLMDYLANGNIHDLVEKIAGKNESGAIIPEQKTPQLMMYYGG